MPINNETRDVVIQNIKSLTFCLGIQGIDEKQYEVINFIEPQCISQGGATVRDYIIIQLKQIAEISGFIQLNANFSGFSDIGEGESMGILRF